MNQEPFSNQALHTGVISRPKVGLMIMGRKRPGFDPQWGAHIKDLIIKTMESLPWDLVIPSQSIADQAELTRAVERCRTEKVTTLVLVQPTISDGRLAPLLSRIWDKPLVLWATTEKPEGEMISANSLVGTHVMAATLRQLGHPLEIFFGHPEDTQTLERLGQSILAVHSLGSIRHGSLGLIGTPAPGFIDFHSDPVFISERLQSHLFQLNTPELIDRLNQVDAQAVKAEAQVFRSLGLETTDQFAQAMGDDYQGALEMQARYYLAFRELFSQESFSALAFRCWPDLPTLTGHWPYLALSRLVSEGFPIAMEGDIDGALGSLIAESAEMGRVYLSDWLEHDRSTITIWHTGAAPFQLAEPIGSPGGPKLDVQFNNKLPTVVESTIRAGMDVTAFRLWRYQNQYHVTALEGVTEKPKRHIMATNGRFVTQQVNVLDWFEDMVQIGMPHHLCIVQGHHRDTLRRIARMAKFTWV